MTDTGPVVHDTAVTEMLTEIDGWLAPESG